MLRSGRGGWPPPPPPPYGQPDRKISVFFYDFPKTNYWYWNWTWWVQTNAQFFLTLQPPLLQWSLLACLPLKSGWLEQIWPIWAHFWSQLALCSFTQGSTYLNISESDTEKLLLRQGPKKYSDTELRSLVYSWHGPVCWPSTSNPQAE